MQLPHPSLSSSFTIVECVSRLAEGFRFACARHPRAHIVSNASHVRSRGEREPDGNGEEEAQESRASHLLSSQDLDHVYDRNFCFSSFSDGLQSGCSKQGKSRNAAKFSNIGR